MEEVNKNTEVDNTDKKLHISDVIDSKIRISLEVITDHMIKNEFTIIGYMLYKPTIGSIFRLHDKNSNEFIFSTLNPVIEIEDEFNFKTEFCSYRFITYNVLRV